MMILPRQTRDKHRKNSKKARFVESAHNVTRVVLEDVTVDGKRALSLHDINATVNAYVHNISFVQ